MENDVIPRRRIGDGFLFNLLGMNAYMTIHPVHQVVMGGFMFGMVFMATDPVTATSTTKGKLIYGFFGGFFNHDKRLIQHTLKGL